VICVDDPWGRLLVERLATAPFPVRTYSSADLGDDGAFAWGGQRVRVPLVGAHNELNGLAAAHVADLLGGDGAAIAAALSTAPEVPGRFERVDAGQPFTVLVDYSHTPDALRVATSAAATMAAGRTIVVFGCGGERDATKRAPMGEVAASLADVVLVTTDNPRSEDPQTIVDEVLAGARRVHRTPAPEVVAEVDRRRAIGRAIALADDGDVVLLAGKGHEAYQEVQGVKYHFDDREEAFQALGDRGFRRRQ
jgi:UDP-N-acetylmuramoyl-L-alanyl-D-glutamate--2,6-diaminopimelate ligase